MKFSGIAGYQQIKSVLAQMVSNQRIPQALLFSGAQGCGNLPMAVAFAQYVFCKNRTNSDSCGNCSSCIKVEKLAHPDLHFTFPVTNLKNAETSDLLIEEFREAFTQHPYLSQTDWFNHIGSENRQPTITVKESDDILHKLSLTSYEGGFKILILWQPEKLNTSTANKLLKIIEEPPEGTIFILVSHQTDQILPTILSRTQLMHFGPLSEHEIQQGLMMRHQIGEVQAEYIARMADGNFRDAEIIFSEGNEQIQILGHFQKFMRACLKFDAFKVGEWIEETARLGREKQKQFLSYGLKMFRECLLLNNAGQAITGSYGEELEFLKKFSPFVHNRNIEKLSEEFNQAYYHIERNANPKILFMDLALKVNEWLNLPSGKK